MAILLTLWDEHVPLDVEGDDTTRWRWEPVPYTRLRKRVGIRDTGRFNYHLNRLQGRFIDRFDGGYTLQATGQRLVSAIIAGAGLDETVVDPTGIDLDCPRCGASTEVGYRDERFYWRCTTCEGSFNVGDGHPRGLLYRAGLNPRTVADRTPEEMFALSEAVLWHESGTAISGVCPECSGPVRGQLLVCDNHHTGDGPCATCGRQRRFLGYHQCTVCKNAMGLMVDYHVQHHPAVIGFYFEHGFEIVPRRPDSDWLWNFVETQYVNDEDLVSQDPPRVRVTIRYRGYEIQLTVDEELDVLEIIEDGERVGGL